MVFAVVTSQNATYNNNIISYADYFEFTNFTKRFWSRLKMSGSPIILLFVIIVIFRRTGAYLLMTYVIIVYYRRVFFFFTQYYYLQNRRISFLFVWKREYLNSKFLIFKFNIIYILLDIMEWRENIVILRNVSRS